jgi:hypothetical protein
MLQLRKRRLDGDFTGSNLRGCEPVFVQNDTNNKIDFIIFYTKKL